MTIDERRKFQTVEAVLDGYSFDNNLTQTRTLLAAEYFRGCSRAAAECDVQGYFGNSDGTNGWCAEGKPFLNDFLIWPGLPRFARCPECYEQWQRDRLPDMR